MAQNTSLSPEEAKKANIRNIVKVALILAAVTAVEFALAFAWPDGMSRTPLNILFIILTIVKAFYIVGEFMHLKHEVKSLIYSIILPCIFVVWLIIALLVEGNAIIDAILLFWRGGA